MRVMVPAMRLILLATIVACTTLALPASSCSHEVVAQPMRHKAQEADARHPATHNPEPTWLDGRKRQLEAGNSVHCARNIRLLQQGPTPPNLTAGGPPKITIDQLLADIGVSAGPASVSVQVPKPPAGRVPPSNETAAGQPPDLPPVVVNVRIADLFPPAPPGGRRIAADGLAPCADGPASPLTTSSSQSLQDSSRTGNDGSGTAGSPSPVESSTDSLQRQVLSAGPLPLPPGIQQALQTVSGNDRTTQVTPQPASVSLSSLWCTPGSIDCPNSVVPGRRGDGKLLLLLRQHRRLKHQQAAASIHRMKSGQQRRMILMVRSSTQLPERIQRQVATMPGLQQASKVKPSPHQVSLSELNPTSRPVSSTGDALGLRRLLSGNEAELPDNIQQQLQAMSDSQQFSSIRPAAGDVSLDEINDAQGAVRSSGLSGTNDSNRRRLAANSGVSVAHKLLTQQALQGQQSMPASVNSMPCTSRRDLLWPVAQLAELFQWAHTRGSQDQKEDLLLLNFTTALKQQQAAITRAVTLADLNSLGRRALLAGTAGAGGAGGAGGAAGGTGGAAGGVSGSSSSGRPASSGGAGGAGTGRSSSEPTGQAEKAIKDSFGDVDVFNRPLKGTLATLCDAGDGGCK